MERLLKIQFRLHPQERLKLGQAANQRGISLSEMLRLLIALHC